MTISSINWSKIENHNIWAQLKLENFLLGVTSKWKNHFEIWREKRRKLKWKSNFRLYVRLPTEIKNLHMMRFYDIQSGKERNSTNSIFRMNARVLIQRRWRVLYLTTKFIEKFYQKKVWSCLQSHDYSAAILNSTKIIIIFNNYRQGGEW